MQLIDIEQNSYTFDARNAIILHGEDLLNALRDTLSHIETEHRQYIAKLQAQSKSVERFSSLLIVGGTFASLLIFLISLLKLNITEAKNHRLTNLYAAMSQCNQAIVRCSSEAELFPQICRDAVKFGGMKMAWIGMLDQDTRILHSVATFGDGVDYLNEVVISADENEAVGGGPIGAAIRGNQPYWCQDFLRDSATIPWHKQAARAGWGAAAALPLQCDGGGGRHLYALCRRSGRL